MLQISFKRNMLCQWNAFIPVPFLGNQLLNANYMFKLMFIFSLPGFWDAAFPCFLPYVSLNPLPWLLHLPLDCQWSPGLCLRFLPEPSVPKSMTSALTDTSTLPSIYLQHSPKSRTHPCFQVPPRSLHGDVLQVLLTYSVYSGTQYCWPQTPD